MGRKPKGSYTKHNMSIYNLPKTTIPKAISKKFKKPKKQDFSLFVFFTVLFATLFGFLGGAFFIIYFQPGNQNDLEFPDIDFFNQPISEKQILEKEYFSQEAAVIKTVKQVSPAVVSIIVTKDLPVFEEYYSNPFEEFEEFFGKEFDVRVPQYRQKGTEKKEIGGGTGFIISSDGLVFTNKHVVLDKEADYTVITNKGKKYNAKVLARDPIQDLAILKVETDIVLPTVELGDSNNLQIGQTVIAIGNVLGEFRNSISVGVISGLGRTVTASGAGMTEVLEGIIQTDAAINKGNSGGPLLDLKGRVIGINTAMALIAENVGFAIPINSAKRDIKQVKETGKIVYPFLGIYYTLITPELQQEYDLEVDYGVWIGRDNQGRETEQAIFTGSAAEAAGLKKDDIILEFAGEKISLENSLAKIILKYYPGDEVVLKILSNGEQKTTSVILGEHSD